MNTALMYIGIGLIVLGWLSLSYFAFKQLSVQKEYARLPQKWEEVKHDFVKKRTACRMVILAGLILLILSLVI